MAKNIPAKPLRRWAKGEPITAKKLSKAVDAVNDIIKGARPPQQVFRKPSGALRFCVLRELNITVSPFSAKAQRLAYNENTQRLSGEENFPAHVVAVGDVFNVRPPPLMGWFMLNIQGGLRRIQDIVEPENLAGAPVLLINGNSWAWWADMWINNQAMLNPSEENSQGQGA